MSRIEDSEAGREPPPLNLPLNHAGLCFLEGQAPVRQMFDELCGLLERWLPGFEAERRSYMTIAVGCTGGQHRSVYLVEKLAAHFAARGIKSQIRHRELA